MKLRSLRYSWSTASIAWLTVVVLTTAPTLSVGHFVCLRGMAQAGASCPRCNGDGPGADSQCCKWIEPAPTNAVHVTTPTIESPTSQGLLLCDLPNHAGFEWLSSIASPSLHPAIGSPGSYPPQTTILRL